MNEKFGGVMAGQPRVKTYVGDPPGPCGTGFVGRAMQCDAPQANTIQSVLIDTSGIAMTAHAVLCDIEAAVFGPAPQSPADQCKPCAPMGITGEVNSIHESVSHIVERLKALASHLGVK